MRVDTIGAVVCAADRIGAVVVAGAWVVTGACAGALELGRLLG